MQRIHDRIQLLDKKYIERTKPHAANIAHRPRSNRVLVYFRQNSETTGRRRNSTYSKGSVLDVGTTRLMKEKTAQGHQPSACSHSSSNEAQPGSTVHSHAKAEGQLVHSPKNEERWLPPSLCHSQSQNCIAMLLQPHLRFAIQPSEVGTYI